MQAFHAGTSLLCLGTSIDPSNQHSLSTFLKQVRILGTGSSVDLRDQFGALAERLERLARLAALSGRDSGNRSQHQAIDATRGDIRKANQEVHGLR